MRNFLIWNYQFIAFTFINTLRVENSIYLLLSVYKLVYPNDTYIQNNLFDLQVNINNLNVDVNNFENILKVLVEV